MKRFLTNYSKVNFLNRRYITSRQLSSQEAKFNYVQGQKSKQNERQYFYYIDHNGMLFLDDTPIKNFTTCFNEKKFLDFFFRRLRPNKTGQYSDVFPFASACGLEMNFVRCDDVPIVYTAISDTDRLIYASNLSVEFQPEELCMLPQTGRVYHPADERLGGVGLISSSLTIQFSQHFVFGNGEQQPPTQFIWKNKLYKLNNSLCTKFVI